MAEKRGETAARRAPKKKGGKKTGARKQSSAQRAGKTATLQVQVTTEQRYRMIQEAAYYRAEKEGFECDPSRIWLVAEEEIDARLESPRPS